MHKRGRKVRFGRNEAILKALQDVPEGRTVSEICGITDFKRDMVQRSLRELALIGCVERKDSGRAGTGNSLRKPRWAFCSRGPVTTYDPSDLRTASEQVCRDLYLCHLLAGSAFCTSAAFESLRGALTRKEHLGQQRTHSSWR